MSDENKTLTDYRRMFDITDSMPDDFVELKTIRPDDRNPLRIFQTGPGMSGRTFELLFNFNRNGSFYFIDDRSRQGLQEAFECYNPRVCDTLVFENLGSPLADPPSFHLPFKEFEKLTNPSTKTFRGHRPTWNAVWFCSRLSLERLYPDQDPAFLYSRVDLIVYHYLRPDMSWGYVMIDGFDPSNICDSDLQAAALAVDPDAIFFLSDVSPDVPNNYAYASTRFEQLGIPYHLDENGFAYEDKPVLLCPDRTLHEDADGNAIAGTVYNPDKKVLFVQDLSDDNRYYFTGVFPDECRSFRSRITDADFISEIMSSDWARFHRGRKTRRLPDGIDFGFDRPICRRFLPDDFKDR